MKPSSKLIAHPADALPAAVWDAQYQLVLREPYLVLGNIVRLIDGATKASSTSVDSSRILGNRHGKAANLHWITLQSVDAPDSVSTGRIVVEHGQTSARVRAAESGTHEVRLHDRYPQKDTHLVARAPVRVLAAHGKADIPPVAGAPSNEKECLDRWLASQKLDAYGSPEGSVYADISPLFDQSSDRMTPRTAYLYAKLPNAKLACASP